MADQSGSNNPNWKGGRVVDPRGYVLIRVGKGHPLADVRGYAYEHRLKAAEKAGRLPKRKEHVHHGNEDKGDNSDDNLELLTIPEHRLRHRKSGKALRMPGERNRRIRCKCGCGETFLKYDATGRPRRFVSGHNTRLRNG